MTKAEFIFLLVSWNCVFNIVLHETRESLRTPLMRWVSKRLYAKLIMMLPPFALLTVPCAWVSGRLLKIHY